MSKSPSVETGEGSVILEHALSSARADFKLGPAGVYLLLTPVSYTGRLHDTIMWQAGGDALGWVGPKHLLFGRVSARRPADSAPVMALVESLGFKRSAGSALVPAV